MSECATGPGVTFQAEGVPFSNADEAWIWAVQGMRSRLAGANVKPGMARVIRPCEASDIINCADELYRAGSLRQHELQVLLLYAGYGVAPSMLGKVHEGAIVHWRKGMETLAIKMEQKGIIDAYPCASRRLR